jgi:hypothetical protein
MSRIKLQEAREYLQLSRDSFRDWCTTVNLVAYDYEFSRRQYFLRGEFFANADAQLIKRLKDMHGENWGDFYEYYSDVKAFLTNNNKQKEKLILTYKPVNSEVHKFLNRLRR